MTDKDDIKQIMLLLQTAYPNTEIGEYTPKLYLELLQDIPGDVLKNAVLHHISQSPFYPKVSEIRRAAVEIQVNAPSIPSAYEAWQLVCTAIRRHGHTWYPEFPHPLIQRTVESLGWYELCMSTNQISDRARFIEAYTSFRDREITDATILPQVRDLANQLTAPTRLELPEYVYPETWK